jgi:hypothetical protein
MSSHSSCIVVIAALWASRGKSARQSQGSDQRPAWVAIMAWVGWLEAPTRFAPTTAVGCATVISQPATTAVSLSRAAQPDER